MWLSTLPRRFGILLIIRDRHERSGIVVQWNRGGGGLNKDANVMLLQAFLLHRDSVATQISDHSLYQLHENLKIQTLTAIVTNYCINTSASHYHWACKKDNKSRVLIREFACACAVNAGYMYQASRKTCWKLLVLNFSPNHAYFSRRKM